MCSRPSKIARWFKLSRKFNVSDIICSKIILINVANSPFNEWPGSIYQRSLNKKIEEFEKKLLDCNVFVTVRKNRGTDISAACGQLKSSQSE